MSDGIKESLKPSSDDFTLKSNASRGFYLFALGKIIIKYGILWHNFHNILFLNQCGCLPWMYINFLFMTCAECMWVIIGNIRSICLLWGVEKIRKFTFSHIDTALGLNFLLEKFFKVQTLHKFSERKVLIASYKWRRQCSIK